MDHRLFLRKSTHGIRFCYRKVRRVFKIGQFRTLGFLDVTKQKVGLSYRVKPSLVLLGLPSTRDRCVFIN